MGISAGGIFSDFRLHFCDVASERKADQKSRVRWSQVYFDLRVDRPGSCSQIGNQINKASRRRTTLKVGGVQISRLLRLRTVVLLRT